MPAKSVLFPAFLIAILLCTGISRAQWPAGFVQQDISPSSTYNEPTCMAFGNEGSIFIGERGGAVKVIEGNAARTVYSVGTTINREQGLLKIQVHPRFNQTGWLYLYYMTADNNHHNLGRITLDTNNNVTRVDTLVRLPVLENQGRHNGAGMVFGNDGFLYLGRGNDELGGASNPAASWTSMKGKILRFTENGLPAPGNPHYTTGTTDAERSIWARGFRNPWTMGVDRVSGRLFTGDVGDGYEEINEVTAPSAAEGYWYGYGVGGRDGPNPTGLDNTIEPMYWHNTGGLGECAIVSSVPYHANFSSNWPAQYKNRLYFSDYCRTMIRSVPLNPAANHNPDVNNAASGSVDFGSTPVRTVGLYLGPDGDLYFAGFGGNLRAYRVRYNSPNSIRKSTPMQIVGNFRTHVAPEITLAIPAGFNRKTPSEARFSVSDAKGRILFTGTPSLVGNKLVLNGFRPGVSGIFHCRMTWNSEGRDRTLRGLITVLP